MFVRKDIADKALDLISAVWVWNEFCVRLNCVCQACNRWTERQDSKENGIHFQIITFIDGEVVCRQYTLLGTFMQDGRLYIIERKWRARSEMSRMRIADFAGNVHEDKLRRDTTLHGRVADFRRGKELE